MADNRGNSSMSSGKDIVGLHKDISQSKGNYVDTNTIDAINTITKKYERYIKKTFGTLKGFEESIEKATETSIKMKENEVKSIEKFNKELNSLADEFGEDSKEFKGHLKVVKKQMKEIKEGEKENISNIKKSFIKQSFKNESNYRQIGYLNNKWSRGNNLIETSNEYYNQLEKLKSDALDTYGENFQTNKEYKKALMNLNNDYAKDMKDAWKKDFMENHKVLGGIASGIKDTFERNKESLQGLLGPLNLFIEPIKDFFGGFGAIFKFLGGGIKTIFGKFTKKNPTASDVLKSGAFGVGALYIGNMLQKQFGTTKGGNGITDKIKNLFSSDWVKNLSEIFGKNSAFMNNAQLIAGMGGGLMIVGDFVAEFAKTKDWRSALTKGITGSSVLENAVKGALLGFQLGGPMGAIYGAVAGAVLNQVSPQIEKFVRLLTNDNSFKKQDVLKSIEKDVTKGKRTKDELKVYQQLAESMSDEDFAHLGKDALEGITQKRAERVRFLSEGKLKISNDQLATIADDFLIGGKDLVGKIGAENFRKYLLKLNQDFVDEQLLANELSNTHSSLGDLWLSKDKKIENRANEVKKYIGVDDAIIRTDGSIIKTNPQDTLVALKNIPLSMEQVRKNTNKGLNDSLNGLENDGLDKKLTTIIEVLSKILSKDIQVNLPPQTRNDLDMIMSGGMI